MKITMKHSSMCTLPILRTYLLAFSLISVTEKSITTHAFSVSQAPNTIRTIVSENSVDCNAEAHNRIHHGSVNTALHMSTVDMDIPLDFDVHDRDRLNDNNLGANISIQRQQPIKIIKKKARRSHKKMNMKIKKSRSSSVLSSSSPDSPSAQNEISSSTTSPSSRRRLTREEEVSLTGAIRQLKSVIRTRDQLAATKSSPNHNPIIPNPMYKEHLREPKFPYKNHPTEEEWAEACGDDGNGLSVRELRKILLEGKDARATLVSANVGLVLQIAKRYYYELQRSTRAGEGVGTILTLSDLVQEGNMGLMEAAERFDSEKGARFSTYAAFWVKQRVLRSITDNGRVIRLPAHVHNQIRTIRKARSDMEHENGGRPPSLPELANRLEMSPEKLQLYNDSSRSVLSLEEPRGSGSSAKSGSGDVDKRTLGERIASDSPTPEEDAEFDFLKRDIRAAIDALGNDRERDVLCSRFGLIDGNPRTLKETGERLGISTERVRVIENRALNKLRHPQRNYRLAEYVDHPHHYHSSRVEEDHLNMGNISQRRSRGGDNNHHRQRNMGGDALSQFTPEKIWSF